ncbi:MAG: DUF6179 domain-containing protein [Pseudomonadota bacterium]
MDCIKLLSTRCESYNRGESSSIRAEAAESIMKSNLYTIGLYLKSLPDADAAAEELKRAEAAEMYRKGRGLINSRLRAAKDTYRLVMNNRILTPNYTYNATLSDEGAGSFFKLYDPEYEAHETAASIDYQLCTEVTDLAGVEYIQRYLGSLFLENEFCGKFSHMDIHRLLCGYDRGYGDLLINIYEHVLTAAMGCILAERDIISLDISSKDVRMLQGRLSGYDDQAIIMLIRETASKLLAELGIAKPSLISYTLGCLPEITTGIINAVRLDTLDKVFVAKVDTSTRSTIEFEFGRKMEDEVYRELIDDLFECRYLSDKLAIIKNRVRSFGDLEDLLTDGEFSEKETAHVLDLLGDVEISVLIKRHPFKEDIESLDLEEKEQELRVRLKNYIELIDPDRKRKIYEIIDDLGRDSYTL